MPTKSPRALVRETTAQKSLDNLVDSYFDSMPDPHSQSWMYIGERILVAVSLIPLSILFLLIYLLVHCTSRGPAIFSQVRVGMGGRIFTMYKFRSMFIDAEKKLGPTWSPGDSDSRLTRVGRLLRFLHLDELPQLWNVVNGDMRLIGPRPERPVFVLMLVEEVEEYLERLRVRPGITGLAQVFQDADISIDCVKRKVLFDRIYISTHTFALDLRISLCTLVRMLGIRKGRGTRWFRLESYCRKHGLSRRELISASRNMSAHAAGSSFQIDTPLRPVPVNQLQVPAHATENFEVTNSGEAVSSYTNRKAR